MGRLPVRLPLWSSHHERMQMKRFGISVLFAVGGYAIAAFAGYFLVEWLSSNVHDRSVEAAMTSVFVFGPLGAIIGFIAGFVVGGRVSDAASAKSRGT